MRCCARTLRLSSSRPASSVCASSTQYRLQQRRWDSTTAEAPSNPKIAQIVDQISQLTLLETADLVSSLKVLHTPAIYL
jgi:large subunit ribosomal protein L7/L12